MSVMPITKSEDGSHHIMASEAVPAGTTRATPVCTRLSSFSHVHSLGSASLQPFRRERDRIQSLYEKAPIRVCSRTHGCHRPRQFCQTQTRAVMPKSKNQIRVVANEVTVPVTVTDKSGEFAATQASGEGQSSANGKPDGCPRLEREARESKFR